MKNLIIRSVTGILYVAIIIASFLKSIAMIGLFALITGMTIWEFTGLINDKVNANVNRFITTIAGVYLFIAITAFCSDFIPTGAVFIPYIVTLIYLFVAELYAKNTQPIVTWAYTMLSQMWIAVGFAMISVISYVAQDYYTTFSFVLPLSIFIMIWMNDTGAYCTGSLMGKHKLFPRISPNKSWEGSIGGGIFVIIIAITIAYFVQKYDLQCPLKSTLQWIGLGLVVIIFGTWGDLIESLFKRTLGIKDSGTILPGHGGLLDRFDSALLAFPAAVVYVYTISMV